MSAYRPILSSARLDVVNWRLDDAALVQRLHGTPETARYLSGGKPWDLKKAEARLAFWMNDYRQHGVTKFKLVERESGDFVGRAGFSWYPETEGFELGYSFCREAWGRGYATEIARTLAGWFFEKGFADHFTAFAQTENGASIRVMQKIGMRECEPIVIDGVPCRRFEIDRSTWKLA
ncbi:GNAT family N-acetyltransferase [Rhizobium sp. CAU 1783]